MNKFDFWTEGMQDPVLQPTAIKHSKIIPSLVQGKFSVSELGPFF